MRISDIAWNLGGLSLPLGVAVITVPHLIKNLGEERFGLLALAWGLIGYAGALDLGMGRALTQMVARLRGEKKLTEIPTVLATASRITLFAGLIGAAAIAIAAWLGAHRLIRATSLMPGEIQSGMLMLAAALPAQAMSATYRGFNEALFNFKGINLLRAALGVVNFAGPLLVSFYTIELPWLVSTLVVSRLVALVIYRYLAACCLASEPGANGAPVYSPIVARSLFSFGGWVTVSSVVSPLLVQADRFVIAATLSAAAVSTYVVPYEMVVQSLILVGAVSSVMFPGLSKLMREEPEQWVKYFRKWLTRVAVLMTIVCIGIAVSLPVLLPLWIKSGIHPDSVLVGQILCVGVFCNALGSMFYSALHAQGRADMTAKLHLIEFPLFCIGLFALIGTYGLPGAAWAWVGRMAFDAFALSRLLRKSYA